MRLSLPTLLASTLAVFPYQVSAIRREHPPSSLILSSRQHRVPHSILDLCMNVNVDLTSLLPGLGSILDPLDLGSNIQLCLCLKDLDIFLDTNVDIKALVGLLGKNTVSALITALITTSPDASQCSFPPHAHHTCNNDDPCHYECDPHYIRVADTCICAPPYTSCNGNCDIFPKGCGSAVPRSFKARNRPIITIAQAKATCRPHETVCGIPGRENTFDFECIDIDTANDSCGGCLAPHPFPETNPVLHVSGADCTRISNAKTFECSGQRCIVSKCKLGWLPNLARDACTLDSDGPPKLRKVLKREDSLDANAAANTDVGSDLLGKIGAIVRLVSGLDCDLSSLQIPASSSSSTTVISDLLSDVNIATSTLIASTTVPSLLHNLDALLNVSSLLSSAINTCECGTDLGLTNLEDALANIISASLDLKSWCAHNLLTSFNLSGLLSGLGLNNSTGAVVSSDLVDQIKSLVALVVGLVDVGSSLPPPSPGSSSVPMSPIDPSSINTNIIDSIINATAYIVNAPTVNSLVSGIGELVSLSRHASSLLDHCGCVSTLGLGPLATNLAQVANAALSMKDWCDTYPIAGSPPAIGSTNTSALTSISNTDDLSINVGLSNLLGLLRPVENGVAVSGLTTATSTLENGLLGGEPLATGDIFPAPQAGAILNPELVTQLEVLVNLVTELQSSYSPFGSASLNASTLLDPNLVTDIVQKTVNLFNSPTIISLVTNIDALITANSALQTALMNCACINTLGLDGVVNHLVLVTDATLGLKDWCSSNSLVISHPVVSESSTLLPPGTLLPVTAASTTIEVPSHSTTPTAASEPTLSTLPVASPGHAGIVIGLNHLLSGLGLSDIKGVVEVDGLGNGLSGSIDGVLNGLGTGPTDVRRRIVLGKHIAGRQTSEMKDRSQITANSDASVTSELLSRIRSLVGTVLGLTSVGVALPAPSLLAPRPNNIIDSSVVDNVLRATEALLSISSAGALETEVNGLVAASLTSVEALDNCNCIDNLELAATYASLVQVAEASLDLQDWCFGHSELISPSPTSSPVNSHGQPTTTTNTEPIFVSLTKILNGLSLPFKSLDTADGLNEHQSIA